LAIRFTRYSFRQRPCRSRRSKGRASKRHAFRQPAFKQPEFEQPEFEQPAFEQHQAAAQHRIPGSSEPAWRIGKHPSLQGCLLFCGSKVRPSSRGGARLSSSRCPQTQPCEPPQPTPDETTSGRQRATQRHARAAFAIRAEPHAFAALQPERVARFEPMIVRRVDACEP
jgi:hypothetical protein